MDGTDIDCHIFRRENYGIETSESCSTLFKHFVVYLEFNASSQNSRSRNSTFRKQSIVTVIFKAAWPIEFSYTISVIDLKGKC